MSPCSVVPRPMIGPHDLDLGPKALSGTFPAAGTRIWAVRIHHKPFVVWIWVGCLIMALGGALAASDRRYALRLTVRPDERAPGAAQQGMRA